MYPSTSLYNVKRFNEIIGDHKMDYRDQGIKDLRHVIELKNKEIERLLTKVKEWKDYATYLTGTIDYEG